MQGERHLAPPYQYIAPMNKNYGMELAAYTVWANNLTMEWLDQITDEQWTQVIPSSFSSIERTAIHLVSAQKIWIDYWNRVPNPVFLSAVFNGPKSDLIAAWKNVSADLGHFIETYAEANYLQPVLFKWPRGREGRMAFWQSFTHSIEEMKASCLAVGEISGMPRRR
jgi:uncharacterized damage-inducible protein DinB